MDVRLPSTLLLFPLLVLCPYAAAAQSGVIRGTVTDEAGTALNPWAAASPFGYNGRYIYARAEVKLGR